MNVELAMFRAEQVVSDYRKWLELPMTRIVIRALEQINRPVLPSFSDISANATQAALNAGRQHVIEDMQTLHLLHEANEDLIPTYEPEEMEKKKSSRRK